MDRNTMTELHGGLAQKGSDSASCITAIASLG